MVSIVLIAVSTY